MEKSTVLRVCFLISSKFRRAAAREEMFAPNHLTLESKLNFSPFIPPRNGMELVGGSKSISQIGNLRQIGVKINKYFETTS